MDKFRGIIDLETIEDVFHSMDGDGTATEAALMMFAAGHPTPSVPATTPTPAAEPEPEPMSQATALTLLRDHFPHIPDAQLSAAASTPDVVAAVQLLQAVEAEVQAVVLEQLEDMVVSQPDTHAPAPSRLGGSATRGRGRGRGRARGGGGRRGARGRARGRGRDFGRGGGAPHPAVPVWYAGPPSTSGGDVDDAPALPVGMRPQPAAPPAPPAPPSPPLRRSLSASSSASAARRNEALVELQGIAPTVNVEDLRRALAVDAGLLSAVELLQVVDTTDDSTRDDVILHVRNAVEASVARAAASSGATGATAAPAPPPPTLSRGRSAQRKPRVAHLEPSGRGAAARAAVGQTHGTGEAGGGGGGDGGGGDASGMGGGWRTVRQSGRRRGTRGAWSTDFRPNRAELAAEHAFPDLASPSRGASASTSRSPSTGGRGRPPPLRRPAAGAGAGAGKPTASDCSDGSPVTPAVAAHLTRAQKRDLKALQLELLTVDEELVATVFLGLDCKKNEAKKALVELFPAEAASSTVIRDMKDVDFGMAADGGAWSPGVHFPAALARTPVPTADRVAEILLGGGTVRLGSSTGGRGGTRIMSVPAQAPRQHFARFDHTGLARRAPSAASTTVRESEEYCATLTRRVKELVSQAAAAYRKKQPSVAGEYARMAGELKAELGRVKSMAAVLQFRDSRASGGGVAAGRSDVLTVDLHGLTVQSAVSVVDDVLSTATVEGARQVEIITGRGLHSTAGGPRLKPAVRSLLTQRGLPFVPREGAFLVTSLPR